MSVEIGFYGLVALLVLLALRVPVALALMAVSLGGVTWMINWDVAIGMLAGTPYDFVAKWTLSAVPMFLLMGFVSYHAGLTAGLFNAAKVVFRWLPGGLAISSIFASSGFAAYRVQAWPARRPWAVLRFRRWSTAATSRALPAAPLPPVAPLAC